MRQIKSGSTIGKNPIDLFELMMGLTIFANMTDYIY